MGGEITLNVAERRPQLFGAAVRKNFRIFAWLLYSTVLPSPVSALSIHCSEFKLLFYFCNNPILGLPGFEVFKIATLFQTSN